MEMRHFKKSIVGGLLIFGFGVFFGLPSVRAIEYGGLGVSPNVSEVDEKNPLTKSWFIYTLEPGEIKEGKVDIVNLSDEPENIKIYPVDAVTTKDGAFAPEPEDKKRIDVGAWTTLAESEVFLEPREIKTVNFTIKVPKDVEVGDHMGAIIIQAKKPAEEMGGTGLRISTRVGARMYITIPGEIVREWEFKEFISKKQEEKITFYLTFINRGNTRIRTKGEIEITNIFGKVDDVLRIPEREIFPGKTITIPIQWNKVLLLGKFRARAAVSDDSSQILNRELTFLVFPPQRISLPIGVSLGVFSILLAVLFILIGRKSKKQKR